MDQFRKVSLKNRLGEAMEVLVYPLNVSAKHIYLLLALPQSMHPAVFAKNAEYIAHQLRQSCPSLEQGFSLVEMRKEKNKDEVWYDWKFNWVGDTPIDSQCSILTLQKKSYLKGLLDKSQAA